MQKLSIAGRTIVGFFELLLRLLSHASEPFIQQLPPRKLTLEEQRFRLWATNLGLFQHGHSSLDYRLRDADLVKNFALDLLDELIEYLSELTDIISGKRLPYESQPPEDIGVHPVEDESLEIDEDVQPLDDGNDDIGSELELGSESTNSELPLQEVPIRFNGVVERIDSLYSLATKIRNPTTRPIRPTAELYKHHTAGNYLEYMQERINIETHIVRYIHKQQSLEFETSTLDATSATRGCNPSDSDSSDWEVIINGTDDREEFVARLLQEADWLIRRMGKANARRRQQFVYWREHANLISRPEPEPQMDEPLPMRQLLEPDASASVVNTGSDANLPTASQLHSGPTTATRLDPQHVKLDDTKSVITHSSRISTAVGPKGEAVLWPDPPSYVTTDKFFVCQYCMAICPERYLGRDQWKIHLIHDLQPYQCTYKDCIEPDRIYGSRQEWLNHEGLSHTRVWCCSTHIGEEFETQADYLRHLEEDHQNEAPQLRSPELVAACMRPSSIPHRGCPLCPTNFSTVTEMQSHIAYHLERFALLAMPKLSDLEDSTSESGGSIRTGEAAARVPKSRGEDSRRGDFDRSKPLDLKDATEANVDDGDVVKLTSAILKDNAELWTTDERNLSTRSLTQTWVSRLAPSEDMVPADTVPTNQPPWMFLPTRLLLIPRSPGGYLRLLLREEIEEHSVEFQGNDRRYAILGPGLIDFRGYTDRATYLQRRSGFFSTDLLRVASATRSLGIQFLWVPEICIIQMDEDDERREASLESDVYEHATHIWLTKEDLWPIKEEPDPLLAAERRAYETRSMADNVSDLSEDGETRASIESMEDGAL